MFNCPLSSEKADRLIDVLALSEGSRVIDIGCGTGEFLIRLLKRYKVNAIGIDPDAAALEHCRGNADGRILPNLLDLRQQRVAEFAWPDRLFDAAICIGSTHAFGGFVPTLRELKQRVAPGGLIVVGDLFWWKAPTAEYRQVIGDEWPSTDTDYLAHIRMGHEEGLDLLYSTPSTSDEWDHFEGSFAARRYRKAYAQPAELRAAAIEAVRRWQHAYLQWGRETMGFGFYVFLKPAL